MDIQRPQSRQAMPNDAQLVFKGAIFDVYQWEQKMYDGSFQTFEKLKRPDTVVVFGVLDDGSILLTKQQQPGKKQFIGAAGGRIDEGEHPLDAAARELREETGYHADNYTLWHSEQPFSKIDWAVYVFIAKGLHKSEDQELDPGEKISLLPVNFDEFLDLAITDEFTEREIVKYVYEARLHPDKLQELKQLLSPLAETHN